MAAAEFLRSIRSNPRIGLVTVPGQIPGPRAPEHDQRVWKTIEVWDYLRWRGLVAKIILISGLPDRNGLTGARYMRGQFETFGRTRGLDLEPYLEIGEEESAHTGPSIRLLRPHVFKKDGDGRIIPQYDAIGLVTNTPHLRVAGVYAKHLLRPIPIFKISSGDGRGAAAGDALNVAYLKYRIRESLHWMGAWSVDWVWKGTFLDLFDYSNKLRAICCTREWPPIVVV